jgi:enoyl-CoA hydratase/carnithine racemase
MSDVLLVEDRDAVRILTLNRPDKLNALNHALAGALIAALEQADRDRGVRAVVLTGAGRAFCAGADLSEFKDLKPGENQDFVNERAEQAFRLNTMLTKLRTPVIAAARGHAVGGGAGLCLGCDLVVASETLKLGYPELKHDIVAAVVMTGLTRQVGRKMAFELVATGRILDAQEAFDLRMINRIVADDALLDEAVALAAKLAAVAEPAMRTTKELFYRVCELPYDEAMLAGRDTNMIMRGFRKGRD